MEYTVSEVLQYVQENDVKFIRLMFCDIFGQVKNLAIMADTLEDAFTNGVTFDASAVKGFMNIEESDLFLFPDPSTLAVLPWRPQQGRVVRFLCDIRYPDGTPFEGDGRYILRQAERACLDAGYTCRIGSECEFYLFETDETGRPTRIPQDNAGYLDISPLDQGQNVRRDICLTLERMDIKPESSHHEQGPGQNEIDFEYSGALRAADNLSTVKMVIKTIAANNGLFASFLPKPLGNTSGSGLHINMSLEKNGVNIFKSGQSGEHSKEAESFIAGVLHRIREITVFLNPLTNSYHRFGHYDAPDFITWSHQNRSQLIRIAAAKEGHIRMELRSSDPSCNPYLAFALLIRAGLDGIQHKRVLCPPSNFNLYTASEEQLKGIDMLPSTLERAVEAARESEFVHSALPRRTIDSFLEVKQDEWNRYLASVDKDKFETDAYFSIV